MTSLLKMNKRQKSVLILCSTIICLLSILIIRLFLSENHIVTNLPERNLRPSLTHLFGTDWLGRDMFARTIMGLTLSIKVGLLGAFGSSIIALVLGMLAGVNKWLDLLVSWLIDLFLSVPHLVTLILISFALGGGIKGVLIGVMVTHWPSLARLIRAEVIQIQSSDYVKISQRFGYSQIWIAKHHIFPHVFPQLIVGFLLLFPHVILHEAAITFLGMGLSPHEPAIGIILNESMKYLSSGMWWLAFFPGICLLVIVFIFDKIGENLRALFDPSQSQQ